MAKLEALIRVAREVRHRVKEQQERVFKSEFRNAHFGYSMGKDGVEKFVSTPELHSDEAIDPDPLPPGQVWGISLEMLRDPIATRISVETVSLQKAYQRHAELLGEFHSQG